MARSSLIFQTIFPGACLRIQVFFLGGDILEFPIASLLRRSLGRRAQHDNQQHDTQASDTQVSELLHDIIPLRLKTQQLIINGNPHGLEFYLGFPRQFKQNRR
jgi:hypothetical protein